MKIAIAAASVLGLTLFAGAANANDEFLATCEAYAAENSANIDCGCLNDAAQEDPSLYEEYAKVSAPEDAALMSEAAQEVVASCSAE